MWRDQEILLRNIYIFNKAICIDFNALAAFSMKKYQQQNNYVTILAKLQATDFCDREIPDLQIFIVHREWISIALGPGHTSLVPSLETEPWIKSVDIVTDYCSSSIHLHSNYL